MKLDVRFKNKQYNASPYVQESKHQQNIAENDSETQMREK